MRWVPAVAALWVAGCGSDAAPTSVADAGVPYCSADDCLTSIDAGPHDGGSADGPPVDASGSLVDASDASTGPTHVPAACHIATPTALGPATYESRPRPMWNGSEHVFVVRAPVAPAAGSPRALHLLRLDTSGVRTAYTSLGHDGLALATALVDDEVALAFDDVAISSAALRFARYAASGDAVTPTTLVTYGLLDRAIGLTWTGTHYALLWSGGPGANSVRVGLFTSAGVATGASTSLATDHGKCALTWTGAELGATWTAPAPKMASRFSRAAGDGTKLIAPVDVNATGGQAGEMKATALAWTGVGYVAAYLTRTGELGLARLSAAGVSLGPPAVIASVSATAAEGSIDLVWNGNDLALAWTDAAASGATEVWMRRFDAALVPHGPATRVTDLTNELALSGAPVASFPRLSWVGDEYVVSFDAVGQYYVKSVCD